MLLKTLLELPSPSVCLSGLKYFSDHLHDYAITHDHIEELLSIAMNHELHQGGEQEFFATLYAFYALAQLKYSEACAALTHHLNQLKDFDHYWVESYIPAIQMMGEEVIPFLVHACKCISIEFLYIFTESLAVLSNLYPKHREEVLACFDDLLTRVELCAIPERALFSGETAILIGWMGMRAVERIDAIRDLSLKNKFDHAYVGDFQNILAHLYGVENSALIEVN